MIPPYSAYSIHPADVENVLLLKSPLSKVYRQLPVLALAVILAVLAPAPPLTVTV